MVVGGGVAGVEAAFALHELAADHTEVTLLSPDADFLYRPLAVREPFTKLAPLQFPLAEILADAGAHFVPDAFRWLDVAHRTVHTRGGRELGYAALLLALGARTKPLFKHAQTIDAGRVSAHLRGLLEEVQDGSLRRLVALVPSRAGWPLPMYELVLLLCSGARGRGVELELTIVTAEDGPLGAFGTPASDAVSSLLETEGIRVVTSPKFGVPAPGLVAVPGGLELEADRIIALPQCYGPSTPGVPKRARAGFIATDPYCRVRGMRGVYAAGDITDFPLKFGAVAGMQADTAARSIARLAGAEVELVPFTPVIDGALLGGTRPLYLSAHLIGGHCHRSTVSDVAPPRLESKLAASCLGPYLDARAPAAS